MQKTRVLDTAYRTTAAIAPAPRLWHTSTGHRISDLNDLAAP